MLNNLVCEISRKANCSGSSSLPGPAQQSQNWLERRAVAASFDRLLLGNGEKSHLNLIFLSRADTIGSSISSSAGEPWCTQIYLSIPHL